MATCVNQEGYYDCDCNTGFFGDGHGADGCSNIDECAAEINVCFEENTYCMDSVGSYYCLCEIGYVEMDGSCVDFKECEIMTPCHTITEKCIDSTGGYRCICAEGFHRVDSECVDVNECDLPKPGLTGHDHDGIRVQYPIKIW